MLALALFVGCNEGGDAHALTGASCHSEDAGHLCVAIKYVAYRDSNRVPTVTESDASSAIERLNGIWAQCKLSFQVDQFLEVNPADHGLSYNTSSYSDLTKIRNAFNDGRSLLIVTTGPWDRSGTLGNTGANAWTSLPGGGPHGAILEKSVGRFHPIIAHELGHYLNLMHVSSSAQMMNPVIYSSSTVISRSECESARAAAQYFWGNTLR